MADHPKLSEKSAINFTSFYIITYKKIDFRECSFMVLQIVTYLPFLLNSIPLSMLVPLLPI